MDNRKRIEYLTHRYGLNRYCKRVNINSSYASNYINHNIEPTNTTQEGKRVRKALGIIDKSIVKKRKRRAEKKKLYTNRGWKNRGEFENAVGTKKYQIPRKR